MGEELINVDRKDENRTLEIRISFEGIDEDGGAVIYMTIYNIKED